MLWPVYAICAVVVILVIAGIVWLNRAIPRKPMTEEEKLADRAESQTFSL